MNINPGKLTKRITIFKKPNKQDAEGFVENGREIVRECYASFKRLSGNEKLQAGVDMAEEKVRFLCRYSPVEITPRMFIEYKGDIYNIIFVNDYNDAHQYIEIQATRS